MIYNAIKYSLEGVDEPESNGNNPYVWQSVEFDVKDWAFECNFYTDGSISMGVAPKTEEEEIENLTMLNHPDCDFGDFGLIDSFDTRFDWRDLDCELCDTPTSYLPDYLQPYADEFYQCLANARKTACNQWFEFMLKYLRINQKEFGEIVGVSEQTITLWKKNGTWKPWIPLVTRSLAMTVIAKTALDTYDSIRLKRSANLH